MARPLLRVAEVFRQYGDAYRARAGAALSTAHLRVMTAIEQCRTAALGGHVEACDRCGHTRVWYNSCRNRHCPSCQSLARARWVEARTTELLDCEYFHVVFTVPQVVAAVALQNPAVVYGILFRATAETLRTIAADPQHLGAEIGFIAVLHTWDQTLGLHPHLHCVVPGGGLSHDGMRWVACRPGFFLPVRVLSRLFRRLFLRYLEEAFDTGRLRFGRALSALTERRTFVAHLAPARKTEWVVYAKPPFGGPQQVLDYVGRYTHRVAISDDRLVALEAGHVRFRYRNSRTQPPSVATATLSASEFIRRFLLHVLPTGFHRIRHYGLFGNRHRTAKLARCRQLLGTSPPRQTAAPSDYRDRHEALTAESLRTCPSCGDGHMINDNYFCRLPRTRSAGSWTHQSRVKLPVFLAEDGLVTDAQVRRLREKRMSGKTLAAAAAAAGMSERTARQWQSGALPSTAKAPRTWRTREDPFAEVWESEVVPQLVADTDSRLQVLALFKALCRRHPGRFQSGQLRTLQRRVREWRVQDGPDREVYFEQVAVPGREAAFDFTDGSDLGVTLRGVPFPHLLFEWVLSYSKWTYVALAVSETFEALVAGLQGALWMLGAVPAVLRHDNLSAATHELKRSGGRQLTARFQQVMDHYGLDSSRIQPGKPHENGVAEQAHFRTKTAIEQALLLRGERDFADASAYLRFVRGVVDEERNAPAASRLAEERSYLRPLPVARVPEYTTFQCRVRKWSTIRIGSRIYSVPSRLIGHTVEARQHPSTVEILYGGRVLCTMPRLRGGADHRIDYRHIIASLVRKPGAFARYRFREELFPSLTFRAAYDALGRTHGERADVEYVRLLHLAATISERQVEATLQARLDAGDTCEYASVQAAVRPPVPTVPVVHIPRPDLTRYDALLTGGLHG